MGAKTALLAIWDRDPREVLRARPPLDRDAAQRLVERLLSGVAVKYARDGSLGEDTNPEEGTAYAASFPGLDLLCYSKLAMDRPSKLPGTLTRVPKRRVYLHAMHSVVDWFAFGAWSDGSLVRALSVSPDDGVIENIGAPMPFEAPYWAGEHRVESDPEEDGEDDYPLPFHPLELGEEALLALFGFHLEGEMTDIDPLSVPLAGFRLLPALRERRGAR